MTTHRCKNTFTNLSSVFESAVNAVYWFRKFPRWGVRDAGLIHSAFYYTFKFVLVLWMALPQTSYVSLHPCITEYLHSLVVPRSSSAPSSSPSSPATSPSLARPPPTSALRPTLLASRMPPKPLLSFRVSNSRIPGSRSLLVRKKIPHWLLQRRRL